MQHHALLHLLDSHANMIFIHVHATTALHLFAGYTLNRHHHTHITFIHVHAMPPHALLRSFARYANADATYTVSTIIYVNVTPRVTLFVRWTPTTSYWPSPSIVCTPCHTPFSCWLHLMLTPHTIPYQPSPSFMCEPRHILFFYWLRRYWYRLHHSNLPTPYNILYHATPCSLNTTPPQEFLNKDPSHPGSRSPSFLI